MMHRLRTRSELERTDGDPRSNLVERLADDPQLDRQRLVELVRSKRPLLPLDQVDQLIRSADETAIGMGPISPLLADDLVDEIMINGPGPVWIETGGVIRRTDVVMSAYDIDLLVERMLTPLGLRVDRTAPIVDARLPDGSRVNVVVPPLAIDGSTVSIRRFSSVKIPLEAFGPPEMVQTLHRLMQQQATILVSGATSTGKTTLLNALSPLIGCDDRVVCIEDTAELQLACPHLVRLEARPANSEGIGAVGLRDLVLTALRMRPDRLILGEVRGPEAFDLLLAFTTGHRGGLTTCHAAGPLEALRRLEILATLGQENVGVAFLRRQVVQAFDAVVQLERLGAKRSITSISAIRSASDGVDTLWSRSEGARSR